MDEYEEICKMKYPHLGKNRFQSWKDFYLGIVKYIQLLKTEFNYDYSENIHPDIIYYRLKYESKKDAYNRHLEYNCQHNVY